MLFKVFCASIPQCRDQLPMVLYRNSKNKYGSKLLFFYLKMFEPYLFFEFRYSPMGYEQRHYGKLRRRFPKHSFLPKGRIKVRIVSTLSPYSQFAYLCKTLQLFAVAGYNNLLVSNNNNSVQYILLIRKLNFELANCSIILLNVYLNIERKKISKITLINYFNKGEKIDDDNPKNRAN